MARNRKDSTFDYDLQLKDAGLVAADAAAQVGGADKILDLGESRFDGCVIIDISAVEIASNNERFDIHLQFSDSATFASGVVSGPCLPTGALETLIGADTDTTVGRYELPFTNELNGVIYRYARLYTNVTGTIATGINYKAYVVVC
jgi:hypothetical protein